MPTGHNKAVDLLITIILHHILLSLASYKETTLRKSVRLDAYLILLKETALLILISLINLFSESKVTYNVK